jgi:hypothetical protein
MKTLKLVNRTDARLIMGFGDVQTVPGPVSAQPCCKWNIIRR